MRPESAVPNRIDLKFTFYTCLLATLVARYALELTLVLLGFVNDVHISFVVLCSHLHCSFHAKIHYCVINWKVQSDQ